jgi:peptidoglycan/xylan/chitin deacetylase (PgdA/CDA1 family)
LPTPPSRIASVQFTRIGALSAVNQMSRYWRHPAHGHRLRVENGADPALHRRAHDHLKRVSRLWVRTLLHRSHRVAACSSRPTPSLRCEIDTPLGDCCGMSTACRSPVAAQCPTVPNPVREIRLFRPVVYRSTITRALCARQLALRTTPWPLRTILAIDRFSISRVPTTTASS